ncbi:MAG TPA: hypothetical protein VKZ53_21285 [Candidatus Angelobacter sp.]|nr:hypothetical protein [Candidatus Angelobacter sp.]
MTVEFNLLNHVQKYFNEQDDPTAWRAILHVIGKEFIERYRSEREGGDKNWFMRVGACSHWVRPHQTRWTAAGGFALPIGYKGAAGWSHGLPEFDWSVVFSFDGVHWKCVDKFSGKKQAVLRVALPSRTVRHKQAAVHTMWSTLHEPVFYAFRNMDGVWRFVAASDERRRGRLFDTYS